MPFSRDDRLGWLTFCPTNLGTTVRASVHIRLPKISAKPDFKNICDSLKLQVSITTDKNSRFTKNFSTKLLGSFSKYLFKFLYYCDFFLTTKCMPLYFSTNQIFHRNFVKLCQKRHIGTNNRTYLNHHIFYRSVAFTVNIRIPLVVFMIFQIRLD